MFVRLVRKQVSNSIMILKAPNGKPSNLTAEQYSLVRTPQFKAWFGDWEKLAMAKLQDAAMDEVTLANLSKDVSKVVDENGEPLVVYHTVKEEYTGWNVFKVVSYGNEIGSHFGTIEQARHIAENALVDNPKMFVCFLSIKNPLQVDDMGFWTAQNFEFIFKKNNIEYNKSVSFLYGEYPSTNDILDALKQAGVDGFIYSNIYEGDGLSYSIFSPNQIKLADGTNTTFDENNPDIRYNNGGNMKSVSSGTITVGPSHDDGGIPIYNKGTGQMLEVEGGEGIINKRSMALDKKVTFNGEKMTPCEAASEINQMAGGVAYDCDNAVVSKEKYEGGGEFTQGRKAEAEHKETLDKLYHRDITPDEAIDDIVEEHLSEDDKYYSKLSGVIEQSKHKSTRDILREIEPYRKKHQCCYDNKKFNDGGEADKDLSNIELPKNLDNYDILGEKGIYEEKPTVQLSEQDKINAQKLANAIKKMQELINIDYKPVILADTENKKLHRYVEKVRHLNLYKLGWRANVGTSKAWAGICMYGGKQAKREILLSYNFIVGDDDFGENLEDVMLHEIAHAIVSELFILNPFDLPLDKLKPSRIKDLSLYETPLDIIDQTHSKSGGHGIMWAAVCESISKGFICDMFYRLAENNELMKDYKYKCIRCSNEEYGNSPIFASKCSKCGTPVLVMKNKL